MNYDRIFVAVAGLLGAAGVALAAQASHGGGGNYAGITSSMMLFHAPLFLALGFGRAGSFRFLLNSGLLLLLGLLMFCADLSYRDWSGSALFPMSAPIGGSAMILGWLGIAASALFSRPSE